VKDVEVIITAIDVGKTSIDVAEVTRSINVEEGSKVDIF
jgi:hypothetical protein